MDRFTFQQPKTGIGIAKKRPQPTVLNRRREDLISIYLSDIPVGSTSIKEERNEQGTI